MTKEQSFLIQSITERLICYVMRDKGVSVIEAFKEVYGSPKYDLLCDVETGLYIQSPLYVYEWFKGE